MMGGYHVLCSAAAVCLISMLDMTFDRCVSIDHQPASGEGLLVSKSYTCTFSKTDVTDL